LSNNKQHQDGFIVDDENNKEDIPFV